MLFFLDVHSVHEVAVHGCIVRQRPRRGGHARLVPELAKEILLLALHVVVANVVVTLFDVAASASVQRLILLDLVQVLLAVGCQVRHEAGRTEDVP